MTSDRDDKAAHRDTRFPLIALQSGLGGCKTNPHWEDISANQSILTSEGDRELPL